MFSFAGGQNPFSANPLQMLAQAAQSDPDTTGSVGAASPSPAAAPQTPDPSIMDRIGNGFSGKGFFGGADASDSVVDPATGLTRGIERQANMQSMMRLGLTFLAAGQRMTNDQRGAILSRAPALVGDNSALNDFAKSRLEMAKLKLAERQQLQEEQSARAITRALGADAPAAQPSAGAQAVSQAQAGTAAAAEAVGAPTATPAPNFQPPAGQAADAPAPGAIPSAFNPGGVPRPRFSPDEKLAIAAQPTTGGKAQMLGQIIARQGDRQQEGQPIFNTNTQKWETPIYRADGTRVGTRDGGGPPVTTRDVTIDGQQMRQKGYNLPNGQFHVTEQSEIRDPEKDRNDKAYVELASKDRNDLQGVYTEKVQTGIRNYDTMKRIRGEVEEGKGLFGPGSDYAKSALRVMSQLSPGKKEIAEYLNVPANFERVMKSGVAGVIQDFNGSANVSDSDRKFAQEVMQAAATKSRPEIINALTNGMQDQKNLIAKYNENADRHNSGLTGLDERLTNRLKVPTVTRNFDEEERAAEANRAQAAQNSVPAPAVAYLKANPNMAGAFDAKYGAGAAARILGK